jgi:hypothetical protein
LYNYVINLIFGCIFGLTTHALRLLKARKLNTKIFFPTFRLSIDVICKAFHQEKNNCLCVHACVILLIDSRRERLLLKGVGCQTFGDLMALIASLENIVMTDERLLMSEAM